MTLVPNSFKSSRLKKASLIIALISAGWGFSAHAAPVVQTCSPMEVNYNGDRAMGYSLACSAGEWNLQYTGSIPAGLGQTTANYRLGVSHPQGAAFTLDRAVTIPSPSVLGAALIREAVLLDNGDLALSECRVAGCSSYRPLGGVSQYTAHRVPAEALTEQQVNQMLGYESFADTPAKEAASLITTQEAAEEKSTEEEKEIGKVSKNKPISIRSVEGASMKAALERSSQLIKEGKVAQVDVSYNLAKKNPLAKKQIQEVTEVSKAAPLETDLDIDPNLESKRASFDCADSSQLIEIGTTNKLLISQELESLSPATKLYSQTESQLLAERKELLSEIEVLKAEISRLKQEKGSFFDLFKRKKATELKDNITEKTTKSVNVASSQLSSPVEAFAIEENSPVSEEVPPYVEKIIHVGETGVIRILEQNY